MKVCMIGSSERAVAITAFDQENAAGQVWRHFLDQWVQKVQLRASGVYMACRSCAIFTGLF